MRGADRRTTASTRPDTGRGSLEDAHAAAVSDVPAARPVRAAVLSMLWPGLGHAVNGRRRVGLVIAAMTLLVAGGTGLWLSTLTRSELASLVTAPSNLRAIIGIALAAFTIRLVVTLDAVRPNGRRNGRRPGAAAVAVGLVVALIAVPHVIVVTYAQAQLDTVTTVFAAGRASTARPSPLPAGPDIAPPPDRSGVSPGPAASTGESLSSWQGAERLNVAVLGSDGGFDRTGVRTDTIMVMSIEVATGDAVVFSIPRNWERLPFPEGTPAAAAYPDGFDDIANAVYGLGSKRPVLFPGSDDPSGDAIKQALAQLLGIPIHYHVLVDMHAVVDAVDLFGGIDLWVDEHIRDQIKPIEPGGESLTIDVRPGHHHFDGRTTLAYVRSRRQSSDYNRMSRQRCVLGAMVDQVEVADVLLRYPAVTGLVDEHVTTDIPIDDLPDLLTVADRMDTGRIRTVTFVPPDFPDGAAPVARVREEVTRALGAGVPEGTAELASACGP